MVDSHNPKESPCLDNLEETFLRESTSSGYETGFELGKKAGAKEGLQLGSDYGSKMGSEVGFYRGFTMTYIQLLQSDLSQVNKSVKTLSKLKDILDLVDQYPKTNETYCEEKLSAIRTKFKQSTSMLNLKL